MIIRLIESRTITVSIYKQTEKIKVHIVQGVYW